MSNHRTKPKGATSYKETAFGVLPRSQILLLELEGTKRGLEYLEQLVRTGKRPSLSTEIICTLHDKAFGWIFPKWGGKYRKVQVQYSGKEAPHFTKIQELIVDLCRNMEIRLAHLPDKEKGDYIVHLVQLLAWFQHRFVYIHPFLDYNGRTARMLTSYILLTLDLPPLELKAETGIDRKQYIASMQ